MNAAATFWRNVSFGVFLVATGVLLAMGRFWPWILVVLCGMSFLNAALKAQWRWAVHPLLWGGVLSWMYATQYDGICAAVVVLCGGSIILWYVVDLIPRPKPDEHHHAPGPRTVLDAEVVPPEGGSDPGLHR